MNNPTFLDHPLNMQLALRKSLYSTPLKFQDVTISAKLSATCLHAGFDSFGNHSSLWISYPPFRALTECGLTGRFHIESQQQPFVVQSSVRSAICHVCLPKIQLYFSAIFSPNLWRAPPLSKRTYLVGYRISWTTNFASMNISILKRSDVFWDPTYRHCDNWLRLPETPHLTCTF